MRSGAFGNELPNAPCCPPPRSRPYRARIPHAVRHRTARSIVAARPALVPAPAGCAGLRGGLPVLVASLLRAVSPSRASGGALDARPFLFRTAPRRGCGAAVGAVRRSDRARQTLEKQSGRRPIDARVLLSIRAVNCCQQDARPDCSRRAGCACSLGFVWVFGPHVRAG